MGGWRVAGGVLGGKRREKRCDQFHPRDHRLRRTRPKQADTFLELDGQHNHGSADVAGREAGMGNQSVQERP